VEREELDQWLSLCGPHPKDGIFISEDVKDRPELAPVVDRIGRTWGKVERCRILIMMPGSEAIDPHIHKVQSWLFYPHPHPVGLSWRRNGKTYQKPEARGYVSLEADTEHWVDANTTDEPRISIVMEVPNPQLVIGTRTECAKCRKWRNRMPKVIRDYMDRRWPL
jgi:hypothetical protein